MGVNPDDPPPEYDEVTIQVSTVSMQPDATANRRSSTGHHVRFANFNRVVEVERIPSVQSRTETAENCFQSLERICRSGCRSVRKRVDLVIVLSFILFVLIGIIQFGVGLASLVEGSKAVILTGIHSLNTFGICMAIGGIAMFLVSLVTVRTILNSTDALNLTTTGLRTLGICYIYILLFAGAAAIVVSQFSSKDFHSKVVLGMNDTLNGPIVLKEWDEMQNSLKCCGTTKYTDWIYGQWAKDIYRKNNLNRTAFVLPLSCGINVANIEPCEALKGTKKHSSGGYLVLTNLEQVTKCEYGATHAYIYSNGCSKYYFPYLYTIMKTMFIVDLSFIAIVLVILMVLYKMSSRLPQRHRIATYSVGT